MYKELIGQL